MLDVERRTLVNGLRRKCGQAGMQQVEHVCCTTSCPLCISLSAMLSFPVAYPLAGLLYSRLTWGEILHKYTAAAAAVSGVYTSRDAVHAAHHPPTQC